MTPEAVDALKRATTREQYGPFEDNEPLDRLAAGVAPFLSEALVCLKPFKQVFQIKYPNAKVHKTSIQFRITQTQRR